MSPLVGTPATGAAQRMASPADEVDAAVRAVAACRVQLRTLVDPSGSVPVRLPVQR